jgi:hypothetical protein
LSRKKKLEVTIVRDSDIGAELEALYINGERVLEQGDSLDAEAILNALGIEFDIITNAAYERDDVRSFPRQLDDLQVYEDDEEADDDEA